MYAWLGVGWGREGLKDFNDLKVMGLILSLFTWFYPVEQGQCVVGGQGCHMQIVDSGYNIG